MIHPRKTVKSFGYAGRGLAKAWREEHNFRLEIIASIIVVGVAFLLDVSSLGVALVILSCGLVLVLELVNTMIELVSDMLKPRLNQYVQQIKDLAAAAVLVASIAAVLVGLYVLLPVLVQLSWR